MSDRIVKINNFLIHVLRYLIDHCLNFSHWWAVAAILAVILHNHPSSYVIVGGGGLFLYFLWRRKALSVSFLIIFIGLFIDSILQTPSSKLLVTQANWPATIQSIPNIDGDLLTLDLKIKHGQRVKGNYIIKSKEEKQRLMEHLWVGTTCVFSGMAEMPRSPSNFNAFDYPAYLKHKGISFLLEIDGIKQCSAENVGILNRIKQIRQMGIQSVNQNLSQPLNGIVNALVFGERAFMSPDVLEAYQTLGLVHLLAVSGLHVGIVIALCYLSMLRLGFVKEHVHLLLLFIIIPLYAILTGFSPSVMRASLMITLAILGTFFKVKPPPISIIGLSCLILVIVNPDVVFDIGFELSFLVAFSIIISAPTIQKRYKNPLLRTFMMTGIAQTASLPIILYNFYGVSLLSFFLNILFIPFISMIVLPVAIVTVILMLLIPPVANILIHLLTWMIIPAHALLLKCQNMLVFNVVLGRPTQFEMVLLIVGVILVLILWEKWEHFLSATLPIGFILLIGFSHQVLRWVDPNGSVTFLDVGQGDSCLIQLPHDKGVMLIDTGGRLPFKQAEWQKGKDPFDVGKDVVAEQIKAAGVAKINWVLLTHRDMDHIGGLNGLIGRTQIDNIIISDVFQETETEKNWFKRAKSLNIHIQRVKRGTTWGSGEMYLKMLWPIEYEPTSNNRSLVLLAHLGGLNWLFTGDLEKEGEAGLIDLYPRLHIDILKVGHHGSKTSSSPFFINKIRPVLAIISVGEHNHFGHPHPNVLKTFEESHVPILRTDEDGAIKIIFSKEHLLAILKAKK